ncbi:MAG: tetratricopeptide repeat protein [Planctomycetaceae bacterium]
MPYRRWLRSAALAALCVLFLAGDAFPRGGLQWGGRGFNVFQDFGFFTVWGALMGAGIPRRNLEAPRLNLAPTTTNRPLGSSAGPSAGPRNPMLRSTFATEMTGPRFINYSPTVSRGRSLGNPLWDDPAEEPSRSYEPPYFRNYNNYWLRGFWGGGMWGWGRWGGSIGIWSFPRWWLGDLYYTSGYGLFENPFVGAGRQEPDPFDYSRLLQRLGDSVNIVSAFDPARQRALRSPAEAAGLRVFDRAREAFRAGDYERALGDINAALGHLPRDTALHEFRALVLFARGDFSRAAAAIYCVLAVSPGWNWTTLSSLYPTSDEYTRHLRALEAHCQESPDAADAAFLLGYQYITCGHFPPAVRQLQSVVNLLPHDQLAPHLLTLISGAETDVAAEDQEETAFEFAESERSEPRPVVDQARLVGTWRAARKGATSVGLTLAPDDKFDWRTATPEGARTTTGRYFVLSDVLVMEGLRGEPMIGTVVLRESGGFNFRLIGADPADTGLDFAP